MESILKIVVLGGTFNPVHNGHIHIARQFAARIGAQKVLLIPTHLPPHKQAPDLASDADRLAMCRLAARENPGFEVSDMEILRGGPSYTSDTLRDLKKRHPDSNLYLIMGEDMFLTLLDWHEPEVILSLATLCAAPRNRGGCVALQRYAAGLERRGARTLVMDIEYLPVSSTMIRAAVKRGESISALVPREVGKYILENQLYLE